MKSLLPSLLPSLQQQQQQQQILPKTRTISELTSTIRRAGLMGSYSHVVVTPPPSQQHDNKRVIQPKNDNDPVVRKNRLPVGTDHSTTTTTTTSPPPPPQQQQHHHRRRRRQRRAQSVLEELQYIRTWHIQHGYYGGIVLRDITSVPTTVPEVITEFKESLPNNSNNDKNHNHDNSNNNKKNDTMKSTLDNTLSSIFHGRYDYMQHIYHQWQIYIQEQSMARRECYYIYYEICPMTGKTTQQIYIRGTTIWMDIVTCLLTYMIYDHELSCHVHYGFQQHTHRILSDIVPLLSKDAHIELCGHSLGGAVASILAMKLHVRGYHITKLTTIGEPAYLYFQPPQPLQHQGYSTTTTRNNHHYHHIRSLLPKDHIRIENDCDIVPYLPPFGSHVGNKIWIIPTGSTQKCSSSSSSSSSSSGSASGSNNNKDSNDRRNNSDVVSSSSSSSSSIPPTRTTSLPETNVFWVESSSETIHDDDDDDDDDRDDTPPDDSNNFWWTESIWINFRIPEVLRYYRTSHRISNYMAALQQDNHPK